MELINISSALKKMCEGYARLRFVSRPRRSQPALSSDLQEARMDEIIHGIHLIHRDRVSLSKDPYYYWRQTR